MKKADKKGELVHQHPDVKSDEPKPGTLVKFKIRLWVVKTIKANEVLEIEAPYSRRVKLVSRKLPRFCWCHEGRKNANIKNLDWA